MRGGILVFRSSTTSCIRSGNLLDLISEQIVKATKGKDLFQDVEMEN
jgi:hypothetical protein